MNAMSRNRQQAVAGTLSIFFLLSNFVSLCQGFNSELASFPFLRPKFRVNETIPVYLKASVAQNAYYDAPFCQPDVLWPVKPSWIFNEEFLPTSYDIKMLRNESCKVLCVSPKFEKQGESSKVFMNLLSNSDLKVQLMLADTLVESGAVGFHTADDFFIYNHLEFLLQYQAVTRLQDDLRLSVTNARIVPHSIQHRPDNSLQCPLFSHGQKAAGDVIFTYSVTWVPDGKLESPEDNLHNNGLRPLGQDAAFPVFNMAVALISLFLSALILCIRRKTIMRQLVEVESVVSCALSSLTFTLLLSLVPTGAQLVSCLVLSLIHLHLSGQMGLWHLQVYLVSTGLVAGLISKMSGTADKALLVSIVLPPTLVATLLHLIDIVLSSTTSSPLLRVSFISLLELLSLNAASVYAGANLPCPVYQLVHLAHQERASKCASAAAEVFEQLAFSAALCCIMGTEGVLFRLLSGASIKGKAFFLLGAVIITVSACIIVGTMRSSWSCSNRYWRALIVPLQAGIISGSLGLPFLVWKRAPAEVLLSFISSVALALMILAAFNIGAIVPWVRCNSELVYYKRHKFEATKC